MALKPIDPAATPGPAPKQSGRFLGWRMVMVAFFVDFVAVGFFFYSYGVFFKAMAAEFGDSRLGVALGLTLSQSVGALLAPLLGRALDRLPLRLIIGAGATSMSLGFLGLSQVTSQLQFYLVLAVFIGFGAGAMGGLATAKLIANWFERRRGTALGIAATGISLSGVVMPLITAAIIEAYGWRQGFLAYGLFTACIVVPVVLKWVISKPEDVGLLPDGQLPKPAVPAVSPIAPAGRILRTPDYWILALGLALLMCCMSATLTHMVPRLTDAGYSLKQASLMMSLCAGFGVLGKLAIGWLADRWSGRKAFWLATLFQALGQLGMFQLHSAAWFALGAAFFGFGMGGVVPLQGALVGRLFGRERFGRVLGLMRPTMLPIQIVGVPIAGAVYDATGSYDPAFAATFALYAFAALAIYPLRAGRQPLT
ncbi:MAG: MFS transporter [Pseudomonadales bacterium]